MKLYEFNGFPNPARIRIALSEKGMSDDVEFISVDVPAGEHQKPAYIAKNPSGVVPALELDDGTVIAECTAITEYLDHAKGDPVLTGKTPKERAVIHMMQRRAEAKLLDAVATYFHQATPGLGPDIEKIQIKEWGLVQRDVAIAGMHYFDEVLQKQPYIAGNTFSMADITVIAGLMFAGFAQIDVPEECAALRKWHEKVNQRPSLAA